MNDSNAQQLRNEIVKLLPNLRAFARTICNDTSKSDDLVHDTIVKALANLGSFQYGTNLQAWLFTILRNHYYTEVRKRRREVEDVDGARAAQLFTNPNQIDHLAVMDFKAALATLPEEQREALVLVGGSGFSYEKAAEICGCAVGTIKSRVNRARTRLTELLDRDPAHVHDASVESGWGKPKTPAPRKAVRQEP